MSTTMKSGPGAMLPFLSESILAVHTGHGVYFGATPQFEPARNERSNVAHGSKPFGAAGLNNPLNGVEADLWRTCSSAWP